MPSPEARVLYIDRDARQLKRIGRVISPVVAQCTLKGDLSELPPDDSVELIVVNYDSLQKEERARLVREFSTRFERTRLLVLSDGTLREELTGLLSSHVLTNLLACDQIDASGLIVTIQKILRRDIFGIEKYFVWGIEPVRTQINHSNHKQALLDQGQAYAERVGMSSRATKLFVSVIEEFVTNAIFNAPTDRAGKPRFAHLARNREVCLDAGEEISIQFCSDGQQIGVSVSDPFGSLSEDRILDYLAKCLRRGEDQIDTKDGGAGLGLYYAFDALSHFVVNLQPGVRTEMLGFIDFTDSFRDLAKKAKSFNIFVNRDGAVTAEHRIQAALSDSSRTQQTQKGVL